MLVLNAIPYALLVMLFTAVCCYIFIYRLPVSWLKDQPNQRKAHSQPVSRAGGTVLLLFSIVLVMYWDFSNYYYPIILVFLLATIGLLDDFFQLSRWLRLFAYTFFVALLLLHTTNFSTALTLLALVSAVWWLNLYNFMDGINGMAAIHAVYGLGILIALGSLTQPLQLLAVAFIAALVGFLIFNFPWGKIFLGDAGSILLAALLLLLFLESDIHLVAAAIFMGWLIADSSYSLVVRILTGQAWMHAHNQHGYQILARRWQSHTKVTLLYLATSIVWLLPLGYLSLRQAQWQYVLLLLAYTPLLLFLHKIKAGRKP